MEFECGYTLANDCERVWSQLDRVDLDRDEVGDCFLSCEVLTPILQLKSLQNPLRILRIQICYWLFSYVGVEVENRVNLSKICERFWRLQL